MRLHRSMLMWRLMLVVVGAFLLARGVAGAPPSGARAPGKVVHLRVRGDLDCGRLARDVAVQLARVREEEGVPGFILLELDGDRWRGDVVWLIAQEIRGSGAPCAALLSDARGRRVGTGQFMLGVLASSPPPAPGGGADGGGPEPVRVFVSPRMVVGMEPGEDLKAAAPEGTDWEAVEREMQGAAWLALKNAGLDTELSAACLWPGESAWIIGDGETGRKRITVKRPATESGAARIVERTAAMASPRVTIDGELLVEMGAARTARSAGEVLAACGVQGVGKVVIDVESGLAGAERGVRGLVEKVELAVQRAEQTLRDIPRSSEADYEQKKQRAGRAAGVLLEEAAAGLTRAEGIVEEYPELLRANPPTRTSVGQDPERFRVEWRSLFQRHRDEITRLAARAREYADR